MFLLDVPLLVSKGQVDKILQQNFEGEAAVPLSLDWTGVSTLPDGLNLPQIFDDTGITLDLLFFSDGGNFKFASHMYQCKQPLDP